MLKLMLPLVVCTTFVTECTFPPRPGYDRDAGTWKPSPSRHELKADPDVGDARLNAIVKPWLGTPYQYGGETRSGVDCSAFTRFIVKDYKGADLPRSSAAGWGMGAPIEKSALRPGDVVYFGSLWGVNHAGVWVGGGRFVHASTSYGVIITELDTDPYWAGRFKGARRYEAK